MKDSNSNTAFGVLTNHDLDKLGQMLDSQFENKIKPFVRQELKNEIAPLATKEDLRAVQAELNTRIDEGTEAVMGGMDALHEAFVQRTTRKLKV